MSTPLSSGTGYCTPAQFLVRYDWRTVGELLTDSDTAAPPTQSQVLSDATLAALLLAASGEVESACLVGSRYSPSDLSALTGASAAYLAEIVADLCMWKLFKRRPLRDPDRKPPTACADAREVLKQLAGGERIFGLAEVASAGVTSSPEETASDVYARDGLNVQARRLLGRRGWEHWH